MKYIYSIFLFLLIIFNQVNAEIVKRAAFDFGSGNIKLQIAEVDTETHQIVQTLHNDAIRVKLSDDLGRNGNGKLSDSIMNEAVNAAKKLKEKATALGVTQLRGLATEAYRVATNGQDLVDRYQKEVGIPVDIISQEEEGKVGFVELITITGLDPQKTICWDTGGGSFQVTYLNNQGVLESFMGPFGRSSAKNEVIKHIKKQNPNVVRTPNPMSFEEWAASVNHFTSVLPTIPATLKAKIAESDVKVVRKSGHPQSFDTKNGYGLSDILKLARERTNKTDAQFEGFETPETAVTELALSYTILQLLGVEKISAVKTNGSTTAILVSEEYWEL